MTDSTASAPPSAVRQQELVHDIGRHMVAAAPDRWNTLSYGTLGVVGLQEATFQVTLADGATQWLRPPSPAA
ncbi:MAG: hypothetical protein M3137_09775, partial [Actinomycetota bacterium]|nr:hypothetical protein [Actinomycetota bacterium]